LGVVTRRADVDVRERTGTKGKLEAGVRRGTAKGGNGEGERQQAGRLIGQAVWLGRRSGLAPDPDNADERRRGHHVWLRGDGTLSVKDRFVGKRIGERDEGVGSVA